MNQAEEDAPGAIAEVHSDNLRWLISDDDPRRPIGYALLYTEEAIRAAVAQERERAAKCADNYGKDWVWTAHDAGLIAACTNWIAAAIRRGE